MELEEQAEAQKAAGTADQALQGNEEIERSIDAVRQDPTEENLAHALTVIRRRMKAHGHLIAAVEMQPGGQLALRPVTAPDGKQYLAAFTGYEEQSRGGEAVQSAFTAEIEKLFAFALTAEGVEGLILNPWNRTLMLNRDLIRITMGRPADR